MEKWERLRDCIAEKKRVLQTGALTVGVLFVGLGVYRGEAAEVFHKAVRICLECIGIG